MNLPSLSRKAFAKQPIHYLLLDVSNPTTSLIITNVLKDVKNVLCLASSSLWNSNRIPVFGIGIINQSYKEIQELCYLKSNYQNIMTSFSKIFESVTSEENVDSESFSSKLKSALTIVIDKYISRSELLAGLYIEDHPVVFQISVVSTKYLSHLPSMLEGIFSDSTVEKSIHIVMIQISDEIDTSINILNIEEICSTNKLKKLYELSGTIESLEMYFKSWLLDYNHDTEHLILLLPTGGGENILKIKCDLRDFLINSNFHPICTQLHLNTKVLPVDPLSSTIKQVMDVPIFELEVVQRIPKSGISQSVIFGDPKYVIPTETWNASLEEKERNFHCFRFLAANMIKHEEYLLTKLTCSNNYGGISPYFILIPGNNSFIIHSIASCELALPFRRFLKTDKCSEVVSTTIKNILDNLPVTSYNPLLHPSGFYNALHRMAMQKISGEESTVKFSSSVHPELDEPEVVNNAKTKSKHLKIQHNQAINEMIKKINNNKKKQI